MEALAYQYGAKVLNIFDKGNRFKFFQVIDDWHTMNDIVETIVKKSLTTQFLTKFKNSLGYSTKLIETRSKRYS